MDCLADTREKSRLNKNPHAGTTNAIKTPTIAMMDSFDQPELPSDAKAGLNEVAVYTVSSYHYDKWRWSTCSS